MTMTMDSDHKCKLIFLNDSNRLFPNKMLQFNNDNAVYGRRNCILEVKWAFYDTSVFTLNIIHISSLHYAPVIFDKD